MLRMAVMLMFRLTNIQTRQQETYTNRDELLANVNEKSVWAEDRRESFMLFLEQVAEDGSILDTMNLMLPLQAIVEEPLAGFGLKREKKGFSLLQRNKSQTASFQEEPKKELKQEPTKPISAPPSNNNPFQVPQEPAKTIQPTIPVEPQKVQPISKPKKEKIASQPKEKQNSTGFIWKVAAIGALGLSIGTLALLPAQIAISNQKLTNQIKQLEKRLADEESQGQVEAVGRFFVANYYSGNQENISDFLSKKMKSEGVEVKSEQLQSTIYEKQKVTKDTISVTFVITTKGSDESIKTSRLTLPFKIDKKSVYGYVLDGQPKTSKFGR